MQPVLEHVFGLAILKSAEQITEPGLRKLVETPPSTYLRGRLLHSRRQRTSGILSSKAAIPDVYTVAQLGLGYPLNVNAWHKYDVNSLDIFIIKAV